MEIRRKVFSAIEDQDGEIRIFSTNELINEEDYLEMLYSENYLDDEDMERLYSESEEDDDQKKGMSTGAKIALGTTGAAVTAAGALELASLLKKKHLTGEEREILRAFKEQNKSLNKKEFREAVQNERKNLTANHKGIGFVEKANEKIVAIPGKVKGYFNSVKEQRAKRKANAK